MNILPEEYENKTNERKIASIGVRVTKGVTWHGLSLNVNPDLGHYHGIVPCGLTGYKMTSLKAEMVSVDIPEVISVMQSCANTCGIW
jgi:lipoyl(octanoyl) transferase